MTDPSPQLPTFDLGAMATAETVLDDAAKAVATVLNGNDDWGPSGRRDGQYAVDLRADSACLDVLYNAGFRVLSEESGITAPPGMSSDVAETMAIVIVDPLDGSTNASRGIPWFATALCVVDADGPAVALVHNHATGEQFTARRGDGARRNGEPISPSDATELSASIVGVSGLPARHYGWAQFRAMGAAAPDLCSVANGVTDAWCDTHDDGHGVWDYLASVLIVQEAGGVVEDVHGRELCVLDHAGRRSPIAAATAELFAALKSARLKSAHADDLA